MKFPILYHTAKTGATHQWEVESIGDQIVVKHGQVGGVQTTATTVATPKNIGRSNETTGSQQAEIEAAALHKYKLDRTYSLTPSEAKDVVLLPMLAHPMAKYEHKITYPVSVQPKLDGCFTYHSSIVTENGHQPIGKIVEEKIPCKVLSWNEDNGVFEFKCVLNYFNNGAAPQDDWCEIKLENNRRIKTTWNHQFLTNKGWVKARDLNADEHRIASNTADSRVMGLLMGTLLGDANLSFDKRHKDISPRLTFGHASRELLEHKVKVMGIAGNISEETSGYGSKIYRFCSSNHIDANLDVFYHTSPSSAKWGTRRPVTQAMLHNYLSREGLSLWIADDGTLRSNNGNKETPILQIATHSQSDEEVKEIVGYFTSSWGVTPTPIKDKRVETGGGWFLNFKTSDTVLLLSRLREVVWEGAEYKFFFRPEAYVQPTVDVLTYQLFKIHRCRKSLPITKYDIEVEGNHNYVVNGVIAHNCRALARWNPEGTKVILTSRGGKEWKVTQHINEALEAILPKDAVFDGEIYLHGKTFQWITARTKKKQSGTELLEYHVYDMPEVGGQDDLPWQERMVALYGVYNTVGWAGSITPVKAVPTSGAGTPQVVKALHDQYIKDGYEGAIVRTLDGLYEYGFRSQGLLKLKQFDDAEFTIVGYKSGEGIESDLVIWRCKNDVNDLEFDTRPKGTHDDRKKLLLNATTFYGQKLRVKYFGRCDGTDLPRFPIGEGVRLPEDMD